MGRAGGGRGGAMLEKSQQNEWTTDAAAKYKMSSASVPAVSK